MREWHHAKERELKGETRGRDGNRVGLDQECLVAFLGWGKTMQGGKRSEASQG